MIHRLLFLINLLIILTVQTNASQIDDVENVSDIKSIETVSVSDEAALIREKYLKEIAEKNKPGTTAADFRFRLRNGETQKLHNVKSDKPILLLFYNPDCQNCHEVIENLSQSDLPNRLMVLAIDAEEDSELFEETKDELPAEWTVGFAIDPIDEEEVYVFLSIPTLFLLSPDKTVLLKETDISEINRYLSSDFIP